MTPARSLRVLPIFFVWLGCRNAATPPSPQAAPGPAPFVIRFAEQGNQGLFAYAKREHSFDRELAKVNARIEFVPAAAAFSANFEAMNAGAINASGGAISPIVGALAHGLPFKIYGIADPSGAGRAGVIVPAGSSIRSVKDLVGKRVAVNLAAHGDYILLKALANAEVPASKVERVAIQPPDAAAAFATGKIDAWSTFGTFFSTAVRNGARVIALERDIGSDDVSVLAAQAGALEQNPAAFQTLVRVSQELTAYGHAHPEAFQNVLTDKGPRAVSGEELRIATDETRIWPTHHVPTAADRQRIANVTKLFVANKSIDRDIAVDAIVFDVDQAVKARAAVLAAGVARP